jgi:hypothetical protein
LPRISSKLHQLGGIRRLRVILAAILPLVLFVYSAQAEDKQVNTMREMFERIFSCWRPPPASVANPIDITVMMSFNRDGQILGHPRITYESEQASDNDRLQYRLAVMDALQRCTPMPFTEGMAGAWAGRPFTVRFKKPQPKEKQAWLSPKIL